MHQNNIRRIGDSGEGIREDERKSCHKIRREEGGELCE
jgi:hypothetical protein